MTAHQVILRNETNKAIVITIENVQTELNSKLLNTLYNKVIVAIEDKISAYLKNTAAAQKQLTVSGVYYSLNPVD